MGAGQGAQAKPAELMADPACAAAPLPIPPRQLQVLIARARLLLRPSDEFASVTDTTTRPGKVLLALAFRKVSLVVEIDAGEWDAFKTLGLMGFELQPGDSAYTRALEVAQHLAKSIISAIPKEVDRKSVV